MLLADVAVVGGGPAGAAAAITLARAGRQVVLLDKARFPRDKFCGDGLTASALRVLDQLGLDTGRVESWQPVSEVVVRSPSGRTARFPLPSGPGQLAAVARRRDLDAALVDVVRTTGAQVLEGHAVTGASQDDGGVCLSAAGVGEVHARYVVGADGMWSPLRKAVGASLDGYRGDWHAFRQYFSGVDPATAGAMHVWFDEDVLPGYIWSFPLPGGRANVGFGIRRGGQVARVQDMKRLWPELLARPHVRAVLGPDAEPEADHRAWPIPARIDAIPLTAGRVLFAGDAAAATDPLTGEGIAQALLTGMLAARAIDEAGPHRPADAAEAYTRAVRRALFADHRLSALLGRVMRHPAGARGAVRIAGVSPWTSRQFARWLMEDYPRALIATPRRWRPTLGRPDAFASPTGTT